MADEQPSTPHYGPQPSPRYGGAMHPQLAMYVSHAEQAIAGARDAINAMITAYREKTVEYAAHAKCCNRGAPVDQLVTGEQIIATMQASAFHETAQMLAVAVSMLAQTDRPAVDPKIAHLDEGGAHGHP